ncbi:copper fist DNA binding domain-containing protein [Lactarius vividus]|nr:copper fist DNA binding domain-containing protein [Lactarius vividus]
MVFINSQKFACESCIKGHRSSSCTHTERPLYEIKKKGRPVSQCERCRQLRNTKRVHSKCTCSDGPAPKVREVTDKVFGTKQKRYIPIVPSLPNGLKDAFTSSNMMPVAAAHPRQKVASLLNPCQCGDVWNCCCKTSTASSTSELASPMQSPISNGENGATPTTLVTSDGLETLARAAALFSSTITPHSPAHHAQQIELASFPGASPTPTPSLSKKHPSPAPTSSPVLDLPPLLFPEISRPTTVVPPFSTFTTLAGSGCTCGLTCRCPDCSTHHSNGESSAGGDCMNCVDQSLRVIDRSSDWKFQSPVLEKFFADAERVPPPPVAGGRPVELPKLCCAGSCGCAGACGCGGDCNGCCEDFGKEALEDSMAPPAGLCCITP